MKMIKKNSSAKILFTMLFAILTFVTVSSATLISCSKGEDDFDSQISQKLFDENQSYWAKFLPKENAPVNQDLTVDVAIIGGGYTGLSAAYNIKKTNPDLNVILLEAKRVGNGASGRNGALVLAQTYSEGGMAMGKNYKYHREIYDITVESMKQLKALAESSGIDPEYVLNGQCAGIFDEDNLKIFREYAVAAQKLGMPIEFWERDKAISKLGSPDLLGAVYDPNGGMVNPAKLVASLKKLAEDAGVVIYENSQVRGFIEGTTVELPVFVDNKKYTVKAGSIVIAANAYAGRTLDFLKEDIIPTHTQVAVTEPLTEEQYKSIGWKDNISWYDDQYAGTDEDATFHMIITKDRRIIIGGGSVEYNEDGSLLYPGDLNVIKSQIQKRLYELYPSLKGVKIENTWDGLMCETNSEGERIGVTGKHKNIYYSLGYNGGQGVNVAYLFGELVSKLYNGESHKLLEIYTK